MGIDLRDVAFRVERAFAIRISQQEAEDVFQEGIVGKLYDHVRDRLDRNRIVAE